MIRRKCAEQIVRRERRGRVSQDEWSGEGCVNSRRRVSSTVGLRFVSEPGAVATGSYIQLGWNQSGVFSRPLKRALESKGDVIPGLRSHKHPTRDARAGAPLPGLSSAAAPRLVELYIDNESLRTISTLPRLHEAIAE